jgi:hypothetical protein
MDFTKLLDRFVEVMGYAIRFLLDFPAGIFLLTYLRFRAMAGPEQAQL